MDDKKPEVILGEEEKRELREGQELYELTRTVGFEILRRKLEDLAYHSWIDPREAASMEEWEWRELNGFHAANAAKELLEWIAKSISRSEYLDKKRRGEIDTRPMKI